VAVGLLAYSGPTGGGHIGPPLPGEGRNAPTGVLREGPGGHIGPPLPGGEGGDVPLVVTPQRGPLHQWDLLRALATLAPAPGKPFRQALAKAHTLVGGRDQVLAITPSLSPDWLPELHRFNRGRHGQGVGVILLDPVSFGPSNLAGLPTAAAETFAALLNGQGVRASVVRRGELHPVSGSYGELSRWEFKTLGTGRVYVRRAPREVMPRGHFSDNDAKMATQDSDKNEGGQP